MKKSYTTVLSIAGSDGSGGAGIQADLKTIAALGCYGLSAITALTAQNTCDVESFTAVEPEFISHQIDVLNKDIRIDAIKIGMLGSQKAIGSIACSIRKMKSLRPIVLDTVLISSSGSHLLPEESIDELKRELFPLARLITPNLPEASKLTGRTELPSSKTEIRKVAEELLITGPEAVLVKGGHMQGDRCEDLLLSGREERWFSSPRISTVNTHGTGCTLSSAIACFLAKGRGLEDAVAEGRNYLLGALEAGSFFRLGKGSGPLDHLYRYRQMPDR
ncbi:MAG: bifunctional hydroxymethylpyrimidine kinase/phosphomethylpyrimidine kinase [Prosthecochloris sp.]|uniref:bifunctional hydroxymethylpyrimidine kinase/phosphomethylpyrimidine kinase n=1 Tax=Prosthecochloris sp. TaxID=290513 RepID=UPI00258B165D|nr:bifunctional hydroxymethylpyrimidine kinase/phosphomethylpyrimidine kinase [Prosthecochloris sp.]MCW8799090.1 bifunctional hydroxymethylpyrimidine kinase/phosphomethylpyrimidine kinase [Prosthecochloris sp.]